MANPFANQSYSDGYKASLNLRKASAKTPDEIARIDKELQRVGGNTASAPAPAMSGGGITPQQRFKVQSFKPPSMPVMGTQEAMSTAQGQLNPLYQQSRSNAGVVNQQQQQLLRQQLNSRGQLSGGLANQGAVNLSTGLQRTLGDIDTQYNTQVASLADQLRQRSQEQARQTLNDAFSRWQGQQGLQMQADTANYGVQRDAVGDQRYSEEQVYMKARDSIQDQWKLKEFDENVRQFGLQRAMQEAGLTGMYNGKATLQKVSADRAYQIDQAQLANSRANTGISAGNLALSREKWNAEKNSNPYQLSTSATNLAISQALNYKTADEAYAALQQYGPAMVDQGVDVNEVLKAVQSRFKNTDPYMMMFP